MFDALIREIGTKLGLSASTVQSLVSALMAKIQGSSGGLSGFLDQFRQAGLGDAVQSWLGSGNPSPMTADQVERVLGRDAIQSMASKASAPVSMATTALAALIPKIIGALTPSGVIPSVLPASVGGPAEHASTSFPRHDVTPAEPGRVRNRWLWPLLLVLGLIGVLWYLLGRGTPWDYTTYMRSANERAAAALQALKPGLSGDDLIRALNLQVVNFATGSADVPEDAKTLLNLSATAMKLAPAGTVIEVGGHTDNTGDTAANEALSLRRAQAVKAYLVSQGVPDAMLAARGYGAGKPVAANDSDEGRFKNRRIEYTLTKWGA